MQHNQIISSPTFGCEYEKLPPSIIFFCNKRHKPLTVVLYVQGRSRKIDASCFRLLSSKLQWDFLLRKNDIWDSLRFFPRLPKKEKGGFLLSIFADVARLTSTSLSGQGPPFQIGKDWDSGIAIPAPMVNSCSPDTKIRHQKPVVNRVK